MDDLSPYPQKARRRSASAHLRAGLRRARWGIAFALIRAAFQIGKGTRRSYQPVGIGGRRAKAVRDAEIRWQAIAGTLRHYSARSMLDIGCAEVAWVDFVSYDPRMPEAMRLFVKRVPRADNDIRLLERAVAEFLAETRRDLGALRQDNAGESPVRGRRASLISHDAMLAQAAEAPPWA